jgi:hypothetical protein
LGGKLVDVFAQWDLAWTLTWVSPRAHLAFNTLHFHHWDFLFAASFLLGLYGLHRLGAVKESGEVEEEVLLNALLSEIKSRSLNVLSSLGTARLITVFPEIIYKYVRQITGKHRGPETDARLKSAQPAEREKPD